MLDIYGVLKTRNKRILISMLSMIIVFVLYGCGNGGELMEEKIKMEQYLNDKYGKEFAVETTDYYTEQLGGDKKIRAIAYPLDDEELKFEVKKMLGQKKWANTDSQYSERYLNFLWDKQMKEQVVTVFGTDILKVGVSAPLLDIEKNLNGKTIALDEALELYKQKISINIRVGFIVANNFELNEDVLQELYSSIESIKNDNFEKQGIIIRYFSEEFKNEVEKDAEKYLMAEASDYRALKQKNTIIFNIEIEDLKNIKQPEDIKKYIIE